MQELDLLSLPISILTLVLENLDSLVEIVRLDSAYCHHHHREIWLDLLESKQFTLPCLVDISESKQLSWVLTKSAKCSRVMFSLDLEAHRGVSRYLQATGSFIREAHFIGGTKAHEMMLVALNCQNLTILKVRNATVTCAMREIMLRNRNLREIDCSKVSCVDRDIFEGISLDKLVIMTMYKADCAAGFFWHDTAFGDSLRAVIWDCCNCTRVDLKALFKNCPGIRSFSATQQSFQVENTDVLGVDIANLCIAGNDYLTDAHIRLILQRLPSLRTLNLQDCPLLTDESLRHIAEFTGDRLEVLFVDIKHPESAETEDNLEIFGQKCTKLRHLNINCDEKVLCSGKGTSSLVSGCPQLQTLEVNNFSSITVSSRGFVKKFRPKLEILERFLEVE